MVMVADAVTATVTNLQPVLDNQPWNGYSYGDGLNVASGATAESAVEPIKLGAFPSVNVTQSYQYISTQEDYDSLVSTEISGAYNSQTIQVSASASFMKSVSYSDTSLTIVAFYDIVSNGYAPPATPYQLTASAQKVADADPVQFRNQYGDYFCATATIGARFIATYTCSTSTSESLMKFSTEVKANNDIMSAAGAAAFEQSMSSNSVSVNCNVTMIGVSGNPPPINDSPASIPDAVAWFLANNSASSFVPQRARFIHYSYLDSKIPITLPIDPDNFALVQQLGTALWQLQSVMNTLPDYYQTAAYTGVPPAVTFGGAYTYLANEFTDSQGALPYDPATTNKFLGQAQALAAALQGPLAVYNFYLGIAPMAASEPGVGSGGDSTQGFGLTSTTTPGLTVQSASDNYKEDYHIGHRDHTFHWPWAPYDASNVTVGWSMQDNWGDGTNGSWKQESAPIINGNTASTSIHSEYDRGFNWTFVVYFIPNSSFPWL
jgi:hypothetical protein